MNTLTAREKTLVEEARFFAARERQDGLEVVHRLREILKLQTHLKLGYSGIFPFCVGELRYSKADAYRKKELLDLLNDVPEAEAVIADGTLNVCNAIQVSVFCKNEELPVEEKRALLKSVENLSKREVEKVLAEKSGSPMPLGLLKIEMDSDFVALFERVKALTSHACPGSSAVEIFKHLMNFYLKKRDPERQVRPVSVPPGELNQAKVRREIWKDAQGHCSFVSRETGRRCAETWQLQIEHCDPKGLGGADSPGNFRLLCRNHNIYAANQVFGARKMARYSKQWGKRRDSAISSPTAVLPVPLFRNRQVTHIQIPSPLDRKPADERPDA